MIKKLLLRFFLLHFVLLVSDSLELASNAYQDNFIDTLTNTSCTDNTVPSVYSSTVTSTKANYNSLLALLFDTLEETDEESEVEEGTHSPVRLFSHFYSLPLNLITPIGTLNFVSYSLGKLTPTNWYILYQVFRI